MKETKNESQVETSVKQNDLLYFIVVEREKTC